MRVGHHRYVQAMIGSVWVAVLMHTVGSTRQYVHYAPSAVLFKLLHQLVDVAVVQLLVHSAIGAWVNVAPSGAGCPVVVAVFAGDGYLCGIRQLCTQTVHFSNQLCYKHSVLLQQL